ncbi:MAG: MucR family transcriptional regulator [Chakrabartia sp.]
MEKEAIVTLTADIVSAHVSNNSVATNDLPALIRSVFEALQGVTTADVVEAERPEPAVPIRSSIKKDAVTCLECGASMKLLKRHLTAEHGMTPAEYKARWGLDDDYPLVAPNYAARRQELAVQMGLGKAPNQKRGRRPKQPA